MCFDRNINGNSDVKFLECDYLLVQQCLKFTLEHFFSLTNWTKYVDQKKKKILKLTAKQPASRFRHQIYSHVEKE